MSREPLPVCTRCGWHDGVGHARECSPEAGAAADKLAASVADVPSTKLGYGFGKLTFQYAEGRSITLRVNGDGTFSVDHLHWLPDGNEWLTRSLVLLLKLQSMRTDTPTAG
jgi:hypothetical protein